MFLPLRAAVCSALTALLCVAEALPSSGSQIEPSPIRSPSVVAGTLRTDRFQILYTEKSQGAAKALGKRIEEIRDDFEKILGRDWPGVTEIRLGVGRREFEALAMPTRVPPKWSVALAYPDRNIILLDALSLSEPDGPRTLRHELSHVALGQLGGSWPRWFQEGMAMYLTGERFSIAQYASLFASIRQARVWHFEDLAVEWPDEPEQVSSAYAQSVSFVAFIVQRHGYRALGELIDHVQRGDAFETGFAKAFKTSIWVDENEWRAQLLARYSWVPILTGGSAVWGLLSLVCVGIYFRQRVLVARRRLAMDAAEALALPGDDSTVLESPAPQSLGETLAAPGVGPPPRL